MQIQTNWSHKTNALTTYMIGAYLLQVREKGPQRVIDHLSARRRARIDQLGSALGTTKDEDVPCFVARGA